MKHGPADFPRALFGDIEGYIEDRHKDEPRGQVIHNARRWYPSVDRLIAVYIELIEYCRQHRLGAFYGVLPRCRHGGGKAADVDGGACVWVDIDFEDFARGEQQARDLLAGFPAQPSIVVNSGHGLHAYWLLYDQESAANLRGYCKALAKTLGGDSAFDAARILRLPGSWNMKWPDEPRQVVVESLDENRRYELSEFDQWLTVEEEPDHVGELPWKEIEVPTDMPQVVRRLLTSNKSLGDLWAGRGKREFDADGKRLDNSRSGYDWSLLTSLVWHGIRDPSVLLAVLRLRFERTGRTHKDSSQRCTVENALTQARRKQPNGGRSSQGEHPQHRDQGRRR